MPGSAPGRRGRLLGANRDFTLLWTGQAVSALGSTTSLVTYPLLVLVVTDSPGLVGLTMAVAMVARLTVGLPGGVLVDRVDKRRLMLVCDLVRAAAQGFVVAGLIGDWLTIGAIMVAVAVEGATSAVFGSAEPTAVRHVVRDDQLPLALARNEARGAAAMLAGPPLGGLLFGLAPWLPFVVDTVSYLVSFVFLMVIRARMPPSTSAESSGPRWKRLVAYRDVLSGLAFVWRQRFLRVSLLLIAGNNLVANALLILAIVVSRQRGDAGVTTGLIVTISAVGTLVGALVAPRAVRWLSVRTILIVNRAVWATSIALLLYVDASYAIAALIGIMFLLGPTGNTAVTTRQMQLTPEELQGRARSAAGFLSGLAGPVGAGLIGVSLDVLGLGRSLFILTGWVLLMLLIAVFSRAVRDGGSTTVTAASEGSG